MSSELAFRAQLILREQRELYDYWRACAQSRPLPSRYDIDPVAIPHLLPGLSLLDAGDGLDSLQYRLAGTRVREIYGAEITGRAVFDVGFQQKRDYWRAVYGKVIDERLPMQGAVRGPAAGREHLFLVWMRLPLAGLSGAVERVLGYDAAVPSSLALTGASPALEESEESRLSPTSGNRRATA
jgi:hypothetical protein